MIEAMIAIIFALILYFSAKKKDNASDTEAAMIAAAAGAVGSVSDWTNGSGPNVKP